MKRTIGIIVIIIILGGGFVTWKAFSRSVPHHADVPVTPEMVARGRYLVVAAGCATCHTAPGGQPFAGGREFDLGRFGKLYSPNITPDKQTGIGTWSDDDFRAAMQLGIAKGGKYLYPAFPFTSYTLLSDADDLAIKAYLFSLKPVHSAAPKNDMKWPFSMRWLMAYWGWLYDPNQRFVSDSHWTPAWNRGKYLVTALTHCGECHTPRNFLQAPDTDRAYAGALTQGWRAYNISSDKRYGVGAWTDEALESYLSTGYAAGHGPASGAMAETISNSLRLLKPADISDMVAYLRSVKPMESGIPSPASTGAPTARKTAAAGPGLDHGRQVYARLCAGCHRPDGVGAPAQYASLRGARSLHDPQAVNLTQVVLHGSSLETPYGHISMPGFGQGHSDRDLADVINYAAAVLGGHSPGLTREDVARRR